MTVVTNDQNFTEGAIALIGSAVYGVISGDVFIPAVVGTIFALRLKWQKRSTSWNDLFTFTFVSFGFGVFVGPWIADAFLPDGNGVKQVGVLLAAFWSVDFLESEWLKKLISNRFSK